MDTQEAVSLKEYFDDKFTASDKALILAFESLKIRLESIDKATEVARQGTEKRLDSINELRQQLASQAGTFVTKESCDAKHGSIQKQVDSLRLDAAVLSGKASQSSVFIAYFVAAISILISVIGIFVKTVH